MPTPATFAPDRTLIGMVHVGALPGTPKHSQPISTIVSTAVQEAKLLQQTGFDAIIIENMHDAPYVHGHRLGPEIVAAMTRVATEVAAVVTIPIGIQILSGGNTHAMAVAHSTGCAFIRCENFVYAHVADEGLLAEAEAGPLLRERKRTGAQSVAVFADIKKKHASHAITADISIEDTAHAAAFFGADGLVVTGAWTGSPADPNDAKIAKRTSGLPVLVGSGVDPSNICDMLAEADGVIVGSSIKQGGLWSNPVCQEKAAALIAAARA